MGKIKLALTLYSLTSEYVTGRRDLEGCLKLAHEMGYKGIEFIPAQMAPEYPAISDEWLELFKGLLDKYELEPVCWSAYIDMGIRTDRDLTPAEIRQYTINDLIYAKKAGFPMVRTQHAISPEIYREMIPWCRKLGVKLVIEMHHPHTPETPVWREYIDLMYGEGRDCLGVVPDFSIYQLYPHKLYMDAMLNGGCRKEKIDAIMKLVDEKAPESAADALDLNEVERSCVPDLFEGYEHCSVDNLEELVPISPYMHGKFYYLENGEHDVCVPFDRILPRIQELGYEGYIAAEYEGHHFSVDIDAREQLERFASIFHKYIKDE